METLEFIDPPVGGTRLRNAPDFSDSESKLQPVPKVTVPVPNPSPPASPTKPLLSAIASPTLSTIPQLLLSASMPSIMNPGSSGGPTPSSSSSSSLAATMSGFTTYNPRGKKDQTVSLLSSKEPLSLPIMTNNFKRFVTVVGPVFWLQDRIEEIVLWKRGVLWTTIWMSGYTLLCFYPRLLFLLPHLVAIGTILATYPYPSDATIDPLYTPDASASHSPATAPPAESAAPWQANIQAIQNLMGAYADLHSIIEPYVPYFCLTPTHFSTNQQFPNTSSSQPITLPSHSQYTTHVLAVLVLSFLPLLFVVHLPWFPVRPLCILGGWTPVILAHPHTQAVLPVLRSVLFPTVKKNVLLLGDRISKLRSYYKIRSSTCQQSSFHYPSGAETEMDEGPLPTRPKPISMFVQRIIDDDRLTDECWNSEMRGVELWENERYSGPTVAPDASPSIAAAMRKGWGKQHLRSSERGPWTRSRDGSNDVSAVGGAGGVEASGEVSNLTFSLAPGWSFVESEDWRKDLQSSWSGCGCDEDGWVYTNDSWVGSRPAPYTSGGGSVTRRRRWLRRVWYSQQKAEADS